MHTQQQECPLCGSLANYELRNHDNVKVFNCPNHKSFSIDSGKTECILKDNSEEDRKQIINENMQMVPDNNMLYISIIEKNNNLILRNVSVYEWL